MKKQHSILFSSLFTYFILLLLFLCIRMFFSTITLPFSENVNDLIITIFLQGGLMFSLSVFFFSYLTKNKPSFTLKHFGYSKISFRPIVLCIVIGFICYFLNIFVASFFNSIVSLFGYEPMPSTASSSATDYSLLAFLLQVIAVAILPAIGEETTHRGLLLNGMSSMGIMKALIFSSLLFGLMHMNINQFFYATVLGFIMGLAVIISKNIWPGIIIHFMNNFLSTYFSFASSGGNKWPLGNIPQLFSSFLTGDGTFISLFIRSVLLLSLVLGLIVLLFVALLKHTRVKKVENMLRDISAINREYMNNPSIYNDNREFETLYTLNKLMGEYNIKSVGHMIFTDLESKYNKPTMFERVCLFSCIVVGALATLSTFIWGIL